MNNIPTDVFHPEMEKLVQILRDKINNDDPQFFRIMVSYFFSKVASAMRTSVDVPGTGPVPVNMYAVNLALSGSGKGHSRDVLEDHVLSQFKTRFFESTYNYVASKNIAQIALKRATRKQTDPDVEKERAEIEFEQLGPLPFVFDSGTTAAVKQMREKLLLGGAGSMNMEIDEIGSNLVGNIDVLTSFLELFDMGKIKQKLTKVTRENTRNEEIDGNTPANMLLFGTPTKLLNGSKTEEEFYEMLETGYARRCFFGFSRSNTKNLDITAEEMLKKLTDPGASTYVHKLSDKLAALGDPGNFGVVLRMDEPTQLYWLEYRIACMKKAAKFSPEHQEVLKTEMEHRYFKALKLAGAYAFIDQSPMITKDHIDYAISLAEASGQALRRILTRDRVHAKLASFIATIGREVTQADLVEELPYYKGSESHKRELMALAIAYGYKNNMVIKREVIDGIEFFSGSTIAETDLTQINLAYSSDITRGYKNDVVAFDQLHKLCTINDYHWVNHHLEDE